MVFFHCCWISDIDTREIEQNLIRAEPMLSWHKSDTQNPMNFSVARHFLQMIYVLSLLLQSVAIYALFCSDHDTIHDQQLWYMINRLSWQWLMFIVHDRQSFIPMINSCDEWSTVFHGNDQYLSYMINSLCICVFSCQTLRLIIQSVLFNFFAGPLYCCWNSSATVWGHKA